jgi:hypothetical protein
MSIELKKWQRRYVKEMEGADPLDLGVVTLEYPAGEWKLNGHTLGENAILHLVNFSLQTLQDAYAGKKLVSEATGAFNKKYDKLIKGTIGVRGANEPVTEYQAVARKQVQAAIKADAINGITAKAFEALEKTAQLEWVDKFILDNDEKVRPIVEEAIAEIKRQAEAKAKLTQAFKF